MNPQIQGDIVFRGKKNSSLLRERIKHKIERWISNKLNTSTKTAIYSVSFMFLSFSGGLPAEWVGCEIKIIIEGRKTFYSRDIADSESKALTRAISHLRPQKGIINTLDGHII